MSDESKSRNFGLPCELDGANTRNFLAEKYPCNPKFS